jgi:hypothetical protein
MTISRRAGYGIGLGLGVAVVAGFGLACWAVGQLTHPALAFTMVWPSSLAALAAAAPSSRISARAQDQDQRRGNPLKYKG